MSVTPGPHPPLDRHLVEPPRARGIFCNRTLNLRAIKAIGYDMDYTLVHYQVEEWERRAYAYLQQKLADQGWPVAGLEFDPRRVIRGLIVDLELGNLLKVNRFGFVKQAIHGTRPMELEEQRRTYAREMVDLREKDRFVFLNTLFSLSEAWMYAQLVDRLDAGQLPRAVGYGDLYRAVRRRINEAHYEGQLKAEIEADPARFVVLDPEAPLALLDQREAGKRLLLITNSEWGYTRAMMSYAFDRYLPRGTGWRDLFELVIVGARKPQFFEQDQPLFELAAEDGLVRPRPAGPDRAGVYLGGSASQVEEYLGLSGSEILYVGDHIFTDVKVTKKLLAWRTALILRELEGEIEELERFHETQERLDALMATKERLELAASQLRLESLRSERGYGERGPLKDHERHAAIAELKAELGRLDLEIAPLARAASELNNPHWGLLLRAGNDKSHLARQIERSADIYTSRVSNFLLHTPYLYLRSPRGSLPHDRDPGSPTP